MKNRKKQRIFVIVSAIVMMAVCVWRLICILQMEENETIYEGLRITYMEVNTDSKENSDVYESAETDVPVEAVMHEIDFDSLKEVNQDIYAWITVDNTKIDYPILQSVKDDFYLDHCINGKMGYPGCIYTNSCTAKDFSSWNTIVYGHNMKNGSMFGCLENSEAFFEDTEYIHIYEPCQNICYRIYAIIEFSDTYLPIAYNEMSQTDRERFLEDVQIAALQNGHIREGMEISTEDKLVTLSTCIREKSNKRLLVIGVQE